MSETKFTKGEWLFNGNEIVTKEAPNKGIAGAMTDADCHLIAAAPDMYKAIQYALGIIWPKGSESVRGMAERSVFDKLKAAQKKARGEHETD